MFYDKLTFVYLEMPKFQKDIKALITKFDKWMFVIRNLNKLDRIPDELREGIFERLFEVAEIAKFSPEEVQAYEDSLKSYRDLKNSLDTAKEEKAIEIAKNLLKNGVSIDIIQISTGLSPEVVESLKRDKKL